MNKITSNIGLLLLLACSSWARQAAYVNCQQGGQNAVTVGLNSTNFVMASYPGCQIRVFLTGTTNLATLFADNLGTPLSNPFTASLTDGHGVFYADNNRYDIQLSGGNPSPGISPAITISDVLLNDPASSLGCSALPALTGDVTSAGATCTTVLPNIATAGTGLKTTINAKGQATVVTTAASTDLSDSAVIARLNAPANFGANAISGGAISGTTGTFSSAITDAGETSSGAISPTVTGLALGDAAHRWDAFLRNLDISTAITTSILNATTINASTINGASEVLSGTLNVSGNSTLNAVSATQITNTGDEILSAGKVVKWNSDTGISRDAAGVIDFGNGTQGDKSGVLKATTYADASANPASTGVIRCGNNVSCISARNAGNTLDLNLWLLDNANNAQVNPPLRLPEQAAPSGIAASGLIWEDLASHKLKANNNATGAVTLAYIDLAQTWTQNQTNMPLVTPSVQQPSFTNMCGQNNVGCKAQRFGASCTTAAAIGASCASTLTWTVAFTDANYTVSCLGSNASGVPLLLNSTHNAASLAVSVVAVTAVAAQFNSIDCIAIHD